MELRHYQRAALDEIRSHFGAGRSKVLLHLATGGGKTLIFCQVLKGVHLKGKRAMMVVRGKKLVDQASKRLEREGVDHGVIMAGHWRRRPTLPIQICSIDTLYARRKKMDLPEFDLIVIDEAHFAVSPSFRWLVQNYPKSFFLPVSATPHVKEGLRHIADEVVYPITLKELITQGFLVPPKYYIPSKPNLKDVKIDSKTGDYNTVDLSRVMEDQPNLYGDMVKAYRDHAYGLATLLFCVSVKHSKMVMESFNAAGIKAEHLDADTPDKDRAEIIERLEKGITKVICNVGILTTGVDIPCVQCIMLARPTKSYNLYIQILGRGTRPFPGKENFIVLDHANCIVEHGFIEDEQECNLDGKPKKGDKPTIVTCVDCYHAWDPYAQWAQKNPIAALTAVGKDYICEGIVFDDGGVPSECGKDMRPDAGTSDGGGGPRKALVDENFEMRHIETAADLEETSFDRFLEKLIKEACARNYKVGWIFHRISENPAFGGDMAKRRSRTIKKLYEEKRGANQ